MKVGDGGLLSVDLYKDNIKQTTQTFEVTSCAFLASTLASAGTIGDNTYLTDFNIFDRVITEQEIGYLHDPTMAPYSYLVDDVALLNVNDTLTTYINTSTTDDTIQGTNLYYTDALAKAVSDVRDDVIDGRITALTTDNITQGTNLHYTDALAKGVSDVRDVLIEAKKDDLWLKEENTIKQETYEVKISNKTTLGSPVITSGVLIHIPFQGSKTPTDGNADKSC